MRSIPRAGLFFFRAGSTEHVRDGFPTVLTGEPYDTFAAYSRDEAFVGE